MWQITQQNRHRKAIQKWLNSLEKKGEILICDSCGKIVNDDSNNREFHYTKLCLRQK